jgi:hypothetical protein
MNGSVLQIGQEDIRVVRNLSGSTIANGTVVMFDGTIGNSGRIKVKPFTGLFDDAHLMYGVATQNIFVSIKQSDLHPNIKAFLDFTFRVIEEGKPHEIAAAFTFGREDLIPAMFTEILRNFEANFPETDLSKLIYYFERHIELDADEHGPMAMKMISELCENSEIKWKEVEEISKLALEKRIGLWDAIEEKIVKSETELV